IEKPQPKLRPRKKIQTISGNTTVKKLEIKKELPNVVHKKLLKKARKKASISKSTVEPKALDETLDEQLKELEAELKQTKSFSLCPLRLCGETLFMFLTVLPLPHSKIQYYFIHIS
ncbi:MAG: hypothetical protein GQ573_09425, partial [Gammaproteobacteria bacterium]|nr:hypothetical protein [Gammaproteobacteria bacterium]